MAFNLMLQKQSRITFYKFSGYDEMFKIITDEYLKEKNYGKE